MKNPLKTIQEKIRSTVAKLKPAPETKGKIFTRSGFVLLAGVPVAVGAVLFGPATITVAAGATALGLLGVGFGLLQEGDNVKYHIAMSKLDAKNAAKTETAPAGPAPKAEPAPVVAKPAAEFTAAAEKKPEEQAPVAAPAVIPAAKPEAPPKP